MLRLPRAVSLVGRSRKCLRAVTTRNRAPVANVTKKHYSNNSSEQPQAAPKRWSRKRKFGLLGLGLLVGWLASTFIEFEFEDEEELEDDESIRVLDSLIPDITRDRNSAFAEFAAASLPVSVCGLTEASGEWRVLSLDGRDISTKELIQLMKDIEERSGKSIFETFDFIIGEGNANSDAAFLAALSGILRLSAKEIEKCFSLFQEFTAETELDQTPEEIATNSPQSFSGMATVNLDSFIRCVDTLLAHRLGPNYRSVRADHPIFAFGPKVALFLSNSNEVIRTYAPAGPTETGVEQARENSAPEPVPLLDALVACCMSLQSAPIIFSLSPIPSVSEVGRNEILRYFPANLSKHNEFISISSSKKVDVDLVAKISQRPSRAQDWLSQFEHAVRAEQLILAKRCMENAIKIFGQDRSPQIRDQLLSTLLGYFSSETLDSDFAPKESKNSDIFSANGISDSLSDLPEMIKSTPDPARKAQLLALESMRRLHLDSNPGPAIKLLDEALVLAGKSGGGDPNLTALLLMRKASLLESPEFLDKAIHILSSSPSPSSLDLLYRVLTSKTITTKSYEAALEAVRISRQIKNPNPERISMALWRLAWLTSDNSKKIAILQEILNTHIPNIANPTVMKRHQAQSLLLLSDALSTQGDIQKALEYSEKACQIHLERTAEPELDRTATLVLHAELLLKSQQNKNFENVEKAVEYLEKALEFSQIDKNLSPSPSQWRITALKIVLPLVANRPTRCDTILRWAIELADADVTADVDVDVATQLEASMIAARISQKCENSALAHMYWNRVLKIATTTTPTDPSVQLRALTSLAQLWVQNDQVTKALEFAQQALPIAEQTGDFESLNTLYGVIVQSYVKQSNYFNAFKYSQLQFENLTRLGRDDPGAHLWLGIALLASDSNGPKLKDSLEHIQKSLALLNQNPNLEQEVEISFTIMAVQESIIKAQKRRNLSYPELIRTESMVRRLKERVAQQQGESRLAARLAVKLGHILEEQGFPADASNHYIEAYAIFDALEDRRSQMEVLLQVAQMQAEKGFLRKAVSCYRNAFNAVRKSPLPTDRPEILANFAEFSANHGLPKTALNALNQLKYELLKNNEYSAAAKNPSFLSEKFLKSCQVAIKLGEYRVAVEDGEKAIEFAKHNYSNPNEQLLNLYEAYIATSVAYEKLGGTGHSEKAAEYSKLASELQEGYTKHVFEEHMGALSRDAELLEVQDLAVDPLFATTTSE